MKRIAFLIVLLGAFAQVACTSDTGAHRVTASGNVDGKASGWTVTTDLPTGWTHDCCTYARAIGVNLVLYQGEWTGKPERVIVLNVWPSKLPTLDAELSDDRKHYLQSDPHGKVDTLAITHAQALACQGVLYQGSDHVDDAVAFCDPGKASGIRFSWSMTVDATDPNRQKLIDTFRQVVQQSSYTDHMQAVAPASNRSTP